MTSKFFLLVLLGIILNLSLRVYFHRTDYLTRYDSSYWHDRYLKSQWVTPDSKESIGDDGLYAYAGWQYIHGKDPSLLNPEMPPLGKYIIGATTLIFGNQNIQALLFGVAILILLYHFARLFLSKTLAVLAVFLFSLEPIFANQLSVSLLDLPELLFLLSSLFLFLKFLKSQKVIFLFASLIFLGLMMSVKFFIVAFLLGVIYVVGLLVLGQKKLLFKFLILAPTTLAIYLLSYTGYFLNGHSFREFLSFQKWTLVFHKESLAFAFPGGPFWMMLLNRWESWFGGLWYRDHVITSAPDWQATWPTLLLLTGAFFVFLLKRTNFSKNYPDKVRLILSLWIFIYFLFLSVIPIFPRYLLLTLPLMYILSFDLIFNLDFPKKFFGFVKKEFKYRKDYLYLGVLFFGFLVWKIPSIISENFIFSSQFAHDLFLVRNVIFGLTPFTQLPPDEFLKTLFLSLAYFLGDGKPSNLFYFLTLTPIIVSLIFYYLFRRKNRKFSLFLFFPTLALFLVLYQIAWAIPIFSRGRDEFIFKNEKEILEFTHRDSEIFSFAYLPINQSSQVEHYRFLYQWYETRRWRGKTLPLGDNEMHLLYVIIEPSLTVGKEEKKMLASTYNLKFQFDQKFSSGIIVWKFDQPEILEKIRKLKND